MARQSKPASTLYGCAWSTNDPVRIELECIKVGGKWNTSDGVDHGLGLAAHVVNFSRLVWPWFKWHRWSLMHLDELCRPSHRLACFGPSSSGKSATTGLVYLVFYFARPENTTVLISSTTRDDLELRIWGEMKRFFSEAKQLCDWLPGNLIDSKQLITTDVKGSEFGRDLRNGIICRPAKIGNKWQVGSNLSPYQGIKNSYMYVAADEFGIMPIGIMDALSNLTSNPRCCASFLGNLGDLDTPLGSAAEPANGWDSLPDSEISRVYNTRWTNGRCLQFVGMDSPNLDYPADAEPYPKLIGRRYIDQCAADYGQDTPFYNMFAAGKIPRGTMENRVLTKADCERNEAFEPVTWGHLPVTRLYCMDLSYTVSHGDRTVGRVLEFGKDIHGNNILAPLGKPLVFTPSDRGDLSVEDQLALQCIIECKKYDIPPSHVFYDGTGRASFTASLMRLWTDDQGHSIGTSVNPIEFGGSATKRPNFINRKYEEDRSSRQKTGDLMPCDEVFDKMVSELWFALRYLVISKQARNLDMETVKEASKRLYKDSTGHRVSVEPKDEVKLRLGRSPDLADCIVTGLEGARRLGFQLGRLDAKFKQNSRWMSKFARTYIETRNAVELAA